MQEISYIHDPIIIPFKTTNSSTNKGLMPVIEYVFLHILQCSEYATLQNLPLLLLWEFATYSNDHQRFLVEYSCQDYNFMLENMLHYYGSYLHMPLC